MIIAKTLRTVLWRLLATEMRLCDILSELAPLQLGVSTFFFQCGNHYHIVDPPAPDSSDESDNDSIFSGFSDLLEMDGEEENGEEERLYAVDEEQEVMDAN